MDAFARTVWDSSAWLAEGRIGGRVLHTLIGYTARPSGLQVLAYGLTLAAILLVGRVHPA